MVPQMVISIAAVNEKTTEDFITKPLVDCEWLSVNKPGSQLLKRKIVLMSEIEMSVSL